MVMEIGDKVRVRADFGFYHYAIYVGPCGPYGEDVVHNEKGGRVVFAYFHDFADGRDVEVAQRAARSWEEREAIVRRAISLLGRRYDLVNFNCEHFANYAIAGVLRSETIAALVALAFVGIGLWAGQRG